MRITEIFTESNINVLNEIANPSSLVQTPASGRVQGVGPGEQDEIVNFLRERGWNTLGKGSYAVVAEKNNQVIKFYKKNTPGSREYTSNPVELVNFVAKIQDPAIRRHFPRFGSVRTVRVDKSDWIMIPTEKLSPEPVNIPFLDKTTKLGPKYDPNRDFWQTQNNQELFDQKYGPGVRQVYKSLEDARELVGSEHNVDDLDMASNTMYRGWIPVFNDPWADN